MISRNKRIFGILLAVPLLLLVPLIAMQFTSDVKWTGFDFAVAGVLLLGSGLVAELVMRNVRNKNYQGGLVVIILTALFLVWAELAVGIVGTPFAGN
ncbi:MAG: hypothetical protein ABJ092_00550 [Gillisia sp.]